jgi:hypothetical protein
MISDSGDIVSARKRTHQRILTEYQHNRSSVALLFQHFRLVVVNTSVSKRPIWLSQGRQPVYRS